MVTWWQGMGISINDLKRIQPIEMLQLVVGHTLRDGKRNDDIEKGLSVFSIEYRTLQKDHLNRCLDDVTKRSWQCTARLKRDPEWRHTAFVRPELANAFNV